MIWSDEKKGWILRRDKRKKLNVPPIIEATDKDAYEDVFRKREMQVELEKSQVKLKKFKKAAKPFTGTKQKINKKIYKKKY